jgi:hypothetical protein
VLKRYFEAQGGGTGGGTGGTGAAAAADAALADLPPAPYMADFVAAFEKVQASVSRADELLYEDLRARLRGGGSV